MWQIQYVSAENFMSFEKVEYAFENKCYVVRGSNLDNDGQQSNGGGKTSFADIAAIALLGYSLTGRNVKNCVNWNSDAKSFTVQVYMDNPEYGLNCYITRKIYAGTKGQELSILVNDVVPVTIPTKKGVENGVDVREGNAYILNEILDIKEDDLLNYYFISKKNYAPFLEINTDRKLEVIGRFSRADVVDRVIKKLEENVKEVDRDILSTQTQIAKAEGHIEALQQMIQDSAKEEFEQEKQNYLGSVCQEIEQIEAKLDVVAKSIEGVAAKKDELSKVEVIDYKTKLEENQKNLDAAKKKLNEHINTITTKDQKLVMYQGLVQSALVCPKCTHKFNVKGTAVPTQPEIEGLTSIINDLKKETGELRDNVSAIDKQLAPIIAEQTAQTMRLNEIKSLERQLKNYDDEYKQLLKQLSEKNAHLAEYDEFHTFEERVGSITIQIEEKHSQLEQMKVNLEELNAENANIKKWMDHFYDFKFYLGNKPIESICALVNEYLKLNGSDLNLFIEGFKKLRSGEIRQALTPVVYRNWMNPQPFDQFSEGEKTRLNLTVDIAFQQLINSASKYGGLDYYQNDELLNPLDSEGVGNAAKAFNQLNKTILLVSHSGADLVYENTILLEKKNKVSHIA